MNRRPKTTFTLWLMLLSTVPGILAAHEDVHSDADRCIDRIASASSPSQRAEVLLDLQRAWRKDPGGSQTAREVLTRCRQSPIPALRSAAAILTPAFPELRDEALEFLLREIKSETDPDVLRNSAVAIQRLRPGPEELAAVLDSVSALTPRLAHLGVSPDLPSAVLAAAARECGPSSYEPLSAFVAENPQAVLGTVDRTHLVLLSTGHLEAFRRWASEVSGDTERRFVFGEGELAAIDRLVSAMHIENSTDRESVSLQFSEILEAVAMDERRPTSMRSLSVIQLVELAKKDSAFAGRAIDLAIRYGDVVQSARDRRVLDDAISRLKGSKE